MFPELSRHRAMSTMNESKNYNSNTDCIHWRKSRLSFRGTSGIKSNRSIWTVNCALSDNFKASVSEYVWLVEPTLCRYLVKHYSDLQQHLYRTPTRANAINYLEEVAKTHVQTILEGRETNIRKNRKFLFLCSTRPLRSLVSYRVEESRRNSTSTRAYITLYLYS